MPSTEPSTANLVLYAVKDQIATITLNRPEKLNAFSDEMVRALADALRRFDVDAEAQVAVLRGEGRAFSSGADVRQRQMRTREEFEQHGGPQGWGAHASDLFSRAVNWKPVIAAPHGYAIGMGLGLVLSCDLICAAAGAKFQITETKRGLAGSRYWALMRFRGAASFATEAALTGRFFTAEEGLEQRIFDRVAPQGAHLDEAYKLAREIADNPPLSVRATVRTRRWYMEQAEREAYLQTNPLKLHLTEDFRESARAFVEKRKAGPFKGR
ncbi:MAG: enoyl-CoA hydratase/isomerase family protein [Alphaproteobacteria bacterium]|nr:enoyl-CoA hydratase/isomerase family protein [Alphaproteobacteria bacterium]